MSGKSCFAHKSKEDKKFVSYMCPQVATSEQCINPEHSQLDQGKKNTSRIVYFLTRIRHKEEENERMKDCQSEDEGNFRGRRGTLEL